MNLKIVLIAAIIVTSSLAHYSAHAQTSIYNYSVTTTSGQVYSLGYWQGKKIMIVVMTSTQSSTDTAILARINSIALAHAGTLRVIVVPSYEDGYTNNQQNTLLSWYASSLDSS